MSPVLDPIIEAPLIRLANRPRPPRARSLWSSFRFAGRGVWHLIRTQRNARIHLAAAIGFTALAIWLGFDATRLAILWLTMALVIVTEAINTTVEAVVDLITDRYHPLARIAKDAAAGAVLIAAIGAVAVGAAIFLPALIDRLLR